MPFIVNFCIGIVDEASVSTAASCIQLAKEATKDDLALCEVDYDKLGDYDDGFKCYKCNCESAWAWSKGKPSYDTWAYDSLRTSVRCSCGYNETPVSDDKCLVK